MSISKKRLMFCLILTAGIVCNRIEPNLSGFYLSILLVCCFPVMGALKNIFMPSIKTEKSKYIMDLEVHEKIVGLIMLGLIVTWFIFELMILL